SKFTNNTAKNQGGAIYNLNTLNTSNNTYTGHTAVNGGAIMNYNGTLTETNNNYNNNTATNNGGAIYNESGTIQETGNFFNDNQATAGCGGAILNCYGGTLEVNNCNYISNTSTSLGGAICSNGNSNISNSCFQENTAKIGRAHV